LGRRLLIFPIGIGLSTLFYSDLPIGLSTPLTINQVVVEQAEDRFIWKWTADHCFTTASAYRAFFVGQHPIPGAKMLRKTRAPGRCKFFIWLALHDR